MRTRDKARIVKMFLEGWDVGRIVAHYYWTTHTWTRDDIESVLREALRKKVKP
jgi:hypothetical protein